MALIGATQLPTYTKFYFLQLNNNLLINHSKLHQNGGDDNNNHWNVKVQLNLTSPKSRVQLLR